MKTNLHGRARSLIVLCALVAATARLQSQETTPPFPYNVSFEPGDAQFAAGDQITIEAVRGTREVITTGQTYSVDGTYTLSSHDEAELSLYATTRSPRPTPVAPKQTVHIRKGSGRFHLVKTMTEEGFLHVSFYPVPSGSGFGGIYFGQGQWALRNGNFGGPGDSSLSAGVPRERGRGQASRAGTTESLCDYLGDPVEPPANMDAAYTSGNLSQALQQAAANAGVALKIVAIDDSEFPFLLGVKCADADFEKVKEQIKKMERYQYTGSVSSHGQYAFNLVPYPAFPAEFSQRISRRLMVRQQMLFNRMTRE